MALGNDMSAQEDRTFLARDAYRAWKRKVQQAAESVVVFTPYLDSLLDRLLRNSALEAEAMAVVTNLSPASGVLDYRAQLIGVRALLRRGVEVRSLLRLHAKVLLCDWRTVTMGSQNFTSYGRGSRETTAVPPDDLGESRFVATLREWFDAAVPVDIVVVERLLAGLENEIKTVQDAREALAASYEQVLDEYQRELERQQQHEEELRRQAQAARPAIAARLGDAVRRAHERLARPVVWARLREVGYWEKYDTLLTDRESDLTRWPTRASDQADAHRSLLRFNMYPVILNPSGRMGFGRVTVTRISYVRRVVGWTAPKSLAGMTYRLRVEFPDKDFEIANLHITLRSTAELSTAMVKLLVRFDGIEAILVGHEIEGVGLLGGDVPGLGWRALAPEDVAASFVTPEAFNQLMKAAFASFKYKELGIARHNARQFFPSGWVRVTLIEYGGQPVLVVSE
jgi:PLD-like domain